MSMSDATLENVPDESGTNGTGFVSKEKPAKQPAPPASNHESVSSSTNNEVDTSTTVSSLKRKHADEGQSFRCNRLLRQTISSPSHFFVHSLYTNQVVFAHYLISLPIPR